MREKILLGIILLLLLFIKFLNPNITENNKKRKWLPATTSHQNKFPALRLIVNESFVKHQAMFY